MATINHTGRISTSFKYSRIPALPSLSLEALERQYSEDDLESIASVSSSVSSRAAQERRRISRAEGCFITKQTGFHLKMTHWIKPVRNDPDLKFRVERLLKDLSVVPREFLLDQPSNLTPLDRNLHYTMDKLGFFAVTCSKETLISLISLVEAENVRWEQLETSEIKYYHPRFFDFTQPPFSDAKFELVVLNPRHFLQKRGSALTVFAEIEDALSGKMYFVSPDGALRERSDNDAPRLAAFSSGARTARDKLNPFLVVLNAEIAFRRFKKGPYTVCDDYQELIDLTIDLVDKIYFQPLMDERKAYNKLIDSRGGIKDVDGDIKMGGTEGVDEEGRKLPGANVDNDKTVTPRKGQTNPNSRMGFVVSPPGPNATHREIVEYNQYLLSGCDNQGAEDDDEEVNYWDDEEDDDVPTHLGNSALDAKLPPPVGATEKVKQWLVEV